MNIINQINKSLLLLLVFTLISSAMAYHIVVKAYENVFAVADFGGF